MTQLPSFTDLGETQAQPAQGPDIPIALAQQQDQAISDVGKSVTDLGASIGRAQYLQGSMQIAYAKSALLTRQAALEDELKNDPDYASIPGKYQGGMQKIIDDTGQMVTDPTHANFFQDYANKEAFAVGQKRMDAVVQVKQKNYTLSSLDQVTQNNLNVALTSADPAQQKAALQNTSDSIDAAVQTGALDPAHAYLMKSKNVETYAKAKLAAMPGSQQVAALQPYLDAMRGQPGGPPPAQAAADAAPNPDGSAPNPPSQAIQAPSSPGALPVNSKLPTDFDGANNYLISKFEGTHYVPDDNGHGPSKFGIVGSANGLTDDQVKNLTPDQAKSIYKTNYWDAIGADDMAPNMRMAAFDTAVNFGVPAAQDMIKQADGDPQKLLDLRTQKHSQLIQNPQYAGSADAWGSRDAMLGRDLGTSPHSAAAQTGSFLDFIPRQDIPQLYNEAHGKAEQQSVVVRGALDTRLNNASAMALNGVQDPNPPTAADFQAAFPDPGAAQAAMEKYHQTQIFANNYRAVQTMGPQQMEDMLKQSEPVPGSPTYDLDVQRRDALAGAIQKVETARQDDPVAYGQQYKMIDADPLKLNDPQTLIQQLNQRTSQAQSMQQSYGTPLKIFSKSEASALAVQMDALPAPQKMALMGSLVAGIPDPRAYQAALQQIRPDSPVTAMAGNLLQIGQQAQVKTGGFLGMGKSDLAIDPARVAANMVEGDNILNPTRAEQGQNGQGKPFPMAPDGTATEPGLRYQFNSFVGDIFKNQPQAADFNYQAFRALYAKNASDAGNYTGVLDNRIATKSLQQLYGTESVDQSNGSKAMPPWGMAPSDFMDAKTQSFTALKAQKPGLANMQASDVSLQNTPNMGQYVMMAGNTPIVDGTGRPIIMDLSRPSVTPNPQIAVSDTPMPLDVAKEPTHKAIPHGLPNKRGQ